MMRTLPFALLLLAVVPGCGDDDDDGAPPDAGDPEPDAGTDSGDDDPLVVETTSGPVRGHVAGGVRAFMGIPYAAPPTGERRWQPPAAPEPWTEPRDAMEAGPACPQKQMLGDSLVEDASEDCLTANVWVRADAGPSLPVLVWLHGGGFVTGSSGEALYDGRLFAQAHDVVLVSLNYRLGALGYLALPDLGEGEGMFGVLDQRAALEWVQDNVAAFGGDPAQVTIFGESAGAMSVCLHLASPGSAGLFAGAILESGSCLIPFSTLEAARATGQQLLESVLCDGETDPIACLRGVEANTLVTSLEADEQASFVDSFIWFPPVDGTVLPAQPSELLAAGEFADVPVVLGTNTEEGALFAQLWYTDLDEAGYEALVRANVGDAADEVLARYPVEAYGDVASVLTAVLTEGIFSCPTRKLARGLAAAGQQVHLYSFGYGPDIPMFPGLGAFHGAEVPYVFGNGLFGALLSDEELTLVAEMQGYWARFATTGDPNGDAAVAWPSWTDEAREHLLIDLPLPLTTGADLLGDACDFWDGVELPR